jgi:hypothetical protein
MTRRRLALALWIAISIVLWNGLYDMRISLGIRNHLFNAALHEAGRGPEVVMSDDMRETVRDAVLVATLWASIVLAAGVATVIGLSAAKRT